MAEKYGACVSYVRKQGKGIGNGQFQMFGSNPVCDFDRFLYIFYQKDSAIFL